MASQQTQQSTGSSQQSSSSSSFSGIEDPTSLANLKTLITQLLSGGTAEQRANAGKKNEAMTLTKDALGNYTKSKAFQDAVDLMAAQLGDSLEANKPAIQRAVEGAGTSAGSMQALLSQNLATDSAQKAGALGAEQAKAYGQITASLLSTLNQSANQVDPVVGDLLKALDLTRISRQTSVSQGSSTQQSSGSGTSSSGDGSGGSGGSGGSRNGSGNRGAPSSMQELLAAAQGGNQSYYGGGNNNGGNGGWESFSYDATDAQNQSTSSYNPSNGIYLENTTNNNNNNNNSGDYTYNGYTDVGYDPYSNSSGFDAYDPYASFYSSDNYYPSEYEN